MSDVVVELITIEDALPLRQRILRPGLPAGQSEYPDDDAATSVHAGVRVDGTVVAVSSFYFEDRPESDAAGVRIRGMATLQEYRGRGFGRDLLEFGLAQPALRDRAEAWCNARLSAAKFYDKLEFRRIGEPFELAGIGPHVVMVRSLAASR